MSGQPFLFDVNVWLALAFPAHPHHSRAVIAFQQATPTRPACFCRTTEQGFLRLATNAAFPRSCNVSGLTNQQALSVLTGFQAAPSVAYREEPSGLVPHRHQFAGLTTASSKVWMDAYLAAFATAGQLELVTFDQAFAQFAGTQVTILTPAAPQP